MSIKAKVRVVTIDRTAGDEQDHESSEAELVEFEFLPRCGDHIIWIGSLDLERLEVIRIEHFPTYPNREREPFARQEPATLITARWVWVV